MPGICTITTPAPSALLTTLTNAKQELNMTTSADDAYITTLITRASALISRHCGRVFGWQSITEVFRYGWQPGIGPTSQVVAPYGTPLQVQYKPLILQFYPFVTGSDAITENGTLLTTGTDYEIDGDAGLVWRLRNGLRSWWGVPEVDVAYKAGYVLPNDTAPVAPNPIPETMPADLELACISMVAAAYAARGRDPTIYNENAAGVGSVTYQRSTATQAIALANMHIDGSIADMLADYRIKDR